MTYQIVLEIPHFNDRDGIDGWSFRRLPNVYETSALPLKLAARYDDANYGEGGMFVVKAGGDVRKDRVYPTFAEIENEGWPF